MSGCVARRWHGTGTTTEKPSNVALAKEVEDKLKAIQSERSKQDDFFWEKPNTQSDEQTRLVTTSPTAVEVPVYDKSKTRGF